MDGVAHLLVGLDIRLFTEVKPGGEALEPHRLLRCEASHERSVDRNLSHGYERRRVGRFLRSDPRRPKLQKAGMEATRRVLGLPFELLTTLVEGSQLRVTRQPRLNRSPVFSIEVDVLLLEDLLPVRRVRVNLLAVFPVHRPHREPWQFGRLHRLEEVVPDLDPFDLGALKLIIARGLDPVSYTHLT